MIDWNDLRYVLALRDGGTMKAAAQLLKTNPTTVSRHIKTLSATFDEPLFNLTKDGKWDLTPTGTSVVKLAEQFQSGLDDLQTTKALHAEGEVVTITSLEFLLAHYIAPSLGTPIPGFPDVRLNLVGANRKLSLAYGEADIALRFGRPVEGQLMASKVAAIGCCAFARPDAQPKGWIAMGEDLDWLPEMRLGHEMFGEGPRLRVSSYYAAREAAKATGLMAVGPCVIMGEDGGLVRLPNVDMVDREVWTVIHETRRFSKQLKATREWLKSAILLQQEKYRTYKKAVAEPYQVIGGSD